MGTVNDHKTEPLPPGTGDATARRPERFRLLTRVAPLIWMVVRGLLPCPDLISRYRMRFAARKLVPRSPWPGEDATGLDAAHLAILRLLWLQRQAHRAVRGRHRDAAAMLARASAETLILGLYCLHEETAVADLEAANLKALRDGLRYLEAAGLVPSHVIEACLAALGEARRGPTVWGMAKRVDEATGANGARDLYWRLYVPASNFTVHAGAGSLTRHVGSAGKITTRPSVAGARRSPARIADACAGLLAAAVAERTGKQSGAFIKYTERHSKRTLLPLAAMAASRATRSVSPRQGAHAIRITLSAVKDVGNYIWSGQVAADPIGVRTARVRSQLAAALHVAEADMPPGAVNPLLDYLAAVVTGAVAGEDAAATWAASTNT